MKMPYKIIHWAMWVLMTFIFISMGAFLKGQSIYIHQQAIDDARTEVYMELTIAELSRVQL